MRTWLRVLLLLVFFFWRQAPAQDFVLHYDIEWTPADVKNPADASQSDQIRAQILGAFGDDLKQLAPELFPFARLERGRTAPWLLLEIWKVKDIGWQFDVRLNGLPFVAASRIPAIAGSGLETGESIESSDWWGGFVRKDMFSALALGLMEEHHRKDLATAVVRKRGVQLCNEDSVRCAVLNLNFKTNAILAKSSFIIDHQSGRIHSVAIGRCADYNHQFPGLVVNQDYPITPENERGDPKDLPATLDDRASFYLLAFVKTEPADCKPRQAVRTPSGVAGGQR